MLDRAQCRTIIENARDDIGGHKGWYQLGDKLRDGLVCRNIIRALLSQQHESFGPAKELIRDVYREVRIAEEGN